MMMIPEPWQNHDHMDPAKRAFYEFHSTFMEPWDGPAAIVATNGSQIAAVLDRNGLRPARYYVTKDDHIIMASEVGVLEVAPENVVMKERLRPGRMLLVDIKEGRIIDDEELKSSMANVAPYQKYLDDNLISISDLETPKDVPGVQMDTILERQQAFGYTYEELRKVLDPMATTGVEPIAAMGVDSPLAVLSEKPQLLYNYFKQLFAQVTNPPIDALREEIVTATVTTIGSEGNVLSADPANARQIRLPYPVFV
jgi:glutamate synthase (ferredoxin)